MRTAPFVLGLAVALAGCAGAHLDADEPIASKQTLEKVTPLKPGASGGELLPEQAAIDVQHYTLRVDIDPEERSLVGSLQMTADVTAPLHDLVLHLDQELQVDEVLVDGKPSSFRHAGGLIRAPLKVALSEGDSLQATIKYSGRPHVAVRAPWDGGFTWSQTEEGMPWFSTTCQGEGADLWWPCKDHPSDKPESMDLFVTVPDPLVVASNGTLQSVTPAGDGKQTYHWHIASPISNYNVALNVGPYERIDAQFTSLDGESFPVYFWVLPESLEKGRAFMPEILDHLAFFENVVGPYPFRAEKYGVVETPHLGMEHQTIIAYGNDFRPGNPDYDWLHHHELSHEWWGNLVTNRDWKDMWIHEGIGTYMQPLYLEQRFGQQAYQQEMRRARARINNQRAVAPREIQDSKQIYFALDGSHDNDIYYKGSWIMHTLRWLLGDEVFFVTLRRMAYPDPSDERVTDGRQVRFSDTEEIRAITEAQAGEDLGWFFEVYLRQPDLPVLEARVENDTLFLEWTVPEGLEFPMPVPLLLGDRMLRVEMPNGQAEVALQGQSFEVDPAQRILKASRRRRGAERGR
ncbi:MAG: M1 family metallopeptidase [Planctomycetota bacterium]|nr:M1 family metallopeptidase [Planctomycetota bacterium]